MADRQPNQTPKRRPQRPASLRRKLAHGSTAVASSSRRRGALAAPEGLEAATFTVDEDEYVVFRLELAAPALPDGLTRAEQGVVRAILAGRSNAEIAAARGTSVNTVANQLRSVYAKLGISGRGELTRRCGRRGPPGDDVKVE